MFDIWKTEFNKIIQEMNKAIKWYNYYEIKNNSKLGNPILINFLFPTHIKLGSHKNFKYRHFNYLIDSSNISGGYILKASGLYNNFRSFNVWNYSSSDSSSDSIKSPF